jgi:hypothetical protein
MNKFIKESLQEVKNAGKNPPFHQELDKKDGKEERDYGKPNIAKTVFLKITTDFLCPGS